MQCYNSDSIIWKVSNIGKKNVKVVDINPKSLFGLRGSREWKGSSSVKLAKNKLILD